MTASPTFLYGITPQIHSDQALLHLTSQAVAAGLGWLQYRDKIRTKPKQISLAKELKTMCEYHGAQLIINDHTDICAEVGAHGVHLGQSDGSVSDARKTLGTDAIIGVTCHQSLTLINAAADMNATYVGVGACFKSMTKPQASVLSHELMQSLCAQSRLPVVLIGGITRDNVQSLLHFKPHAVAVSSGLFDATNVKESFQHWQALLSPLNSGSHTEP